MRRTRFFALALGIMLTMGACAQDEDPSVVEPQATQDAEATDEGDGEGQAGGTTVDLAETDLGEVLVDGEGMTLYVFKQDTDGESACIDACAETWPPLEVDGDPAAGDGVHEDMLGTIEREDGTTQVTYNDRPLYTYAADEEAGDTKGQGIGDNWYVVDVDGEPVED